MKKNSKSVSLLIKEIMKNKGLVILAFCCAILANSLSIASPFLIGLAVDQIIEAGNVSFDILAKYVLLLACLYLISVLFQYLLAYLSSIVTNRTVTSIRSQAFRKLMELPLSYLDAQKHGDIINRLTNDVDAVSDGIFQTLKELLSGIVSVAGAILFMCMINPIISLIVILLTPACFLISAKITKKSRQYFSQQSKLNGQINATAEEFILNGKIVAAFDYQNQGQQRFETVNEELYRAGQKAQFYSSLVNPSTRLINYIIYGLLGIFGGIFTIHGIGGLTVGKISSFISYSTSFAQPINNITSVATQIQSAIASADRIFDLLAQPAQDPDPRNALDLDAPDGSVEFDHVSFSYQKDRPLISDFSLRIEPHTRVAIVGPTGSGKTTLVNLLMRFYETDSGSILVSGVPTNKIKRSSLRNAFGMVLQETWLKSGTIRENIAFGKQDAKENEIIEAAKKAGAHGFIMRLENGYDTEISEGATNISQGQRQLLTIARAMISLPDMLILDEATSNVDTRTEIQIQKAFLSMMKDRTSFIIAHRLSTIREADMILVLDNGNIVERGRHEDLLKKNGLYAKLYHAQFEIQ